MIEIIGWVLVGICCFYLLRNYYVGSFLYPAATAIKDGIQFNFYKYRKQIGGLKPMVGLFKFRNYYLFVLNPFWWQVQEVFENAEMREILYFAQKISKRFE